MLNEFFLVSDSNDDQDITLTPCHCKSVAVKTGQEQNSANIHFRQKVERVVTAPLDGPTVDKFFMQHANLHNTLN